MTQFFEMTSELRYSSANFVGMARSRLTPFGFLYRFLSLSAGKNLRLGLKEVWANGKGLDAIVPAAREWSRPVTRNVLLAGRDDFSKHFATSAALAANAGAALADVIGLYKEVRDSRGGSGFSFNDIAADRAGTRLGELAVGNRESALNIQRMVIAGVSDKDLMPPFADLPEFMPEAEFKRRYGGIGAPAYKAMMDEIERRIAALPLLR